MDEKIKWTTNVSVVNGPSFAFTGSELVEAYEKLQVNIESTKTDTVSLLPADVAIKVLVISVKENIYEDAGKTITYKLGEADKTLAGPLVLTNASAITDLLGNNTTIPFTNNLPHGITIDILVGRDAGPSA